MFVSLSTPSGLQFFCPFHLSASFETVDTEARRIPFLPDQGKRPAPHLFCLRHLMRYVYSFLLAAALPSYALMPCMGACVATMTNVESAPGVWCGEPTAIVNEIIDVVPDMLHDNPDRPCQELKAPAGHGTFLALF
jgi:hypothetical protein